MHSLMKKLIRLEYILLKINSMFYLKHFLILSKSNEIFHVLKLGGHSEKYKIYLLYIYKI